MDDQTDYIRHAEEQLRKGLEGPNVNDPSRPLHVAAAQTYALLAVAKAVGELRWLALTSASSER